MTKRRLTHPGRPPSVPRRVAALLLLTGLTGPVFADEPTLYQRIGGEPVMTRVVDQMVETMVRDPDIAATLKGVNLARFSHNLYVHMCATSGGPCEYRGEDLRTVHAGMHISKAQLDVSSAALVAALDANGVGEREKAELLRIRAPMRREVQEP